MTTARAGLYAALIVAPLAASSLGALILLARRPAVASRPAKARQPERLAPPPPVVAAPSQPATPAIAERPPEPPAEIEPLRVEPRRPPRPARPAEPRPTLRTPEPPQPVLKFPPLEPGRPVAGGYRLQKIRGFTVYINDMVFEGSAADGGKPLDYLQDELDRLARVSPRLLKAMQTVKIFVEWDHVLPEHGEHAVAVFIGGWGEHLRREGIDPRKAGGITLLSLKAVAATMPWLPDERRSLILLHEMAHACHYYDLGYDNATVRNAYEQAMARGLYKAVPDGHRGTVRAYAATDQHEYFAEISCAYLDRCDFFPHDRASLREYDSVGYELMRRVWGDAAGR
jgi:hypothetical protein